MCMSFCSSVPHSNTQNFVLQIKSQGILRFLNSYCQTEVLLPIGREGSARQTLQDVTKHRIHSCWMSRTEFLDEMVVVVVVVVLLLLALLLLLYLLVAVVCELVI